ncbi:MAG: DUF1844 domain-containing protein, partial [Planctomycetota bacterium]
MTDSKSLPGGDFRLFVQKIGLQGFFSLGLLEIPGQGKPEPNLALCSSVIDDLMMLREKTQGNLSEGEQKTLDKYISDLQLQFLEQAKTGKESSAGPA